MGTVINFESKAVESKTDNVIGAGYFGRVILERIAEMSPGDRQDFWYKIFPLDDEDFYDEMEVLAKQVLKEETARREKMLAEVRAQIAAQ